MDLDSDYKKDANSRYKDINFINKYIAVWAYGYLNNFGETEGLYQTINALGYEMKEKDGIFNIIDIGCGVGRTSCDYGLYFHKSKVYGIDKEPLMIEKAKRIVNKDNVIIDIDLSNWGFPKLAIKSFGLNNVEFNEETLERYFRRNELKEFFDIALGVNLLDRCDDIKSSTKLIYDILRKGGIFVGSTPLNLYRKADWHNYGSISKITKTFEEIGFIVDKIFDNLVYREVLDGRKSYEDYNMLVFRLIKN